MVHTMLIFNVYKDTQGVYNQSYGKSEKRDRFIQNQGGFGQSLRRVSYDYPAMGSQGAGFYCRRKSYRTHHRREVHQRAVQAGRIQLGCITTF